MKRRIPIWLLRDVPALFAVLSTFWPLMILVILNGWRVMSGKPVSPSLFTRLPVLLVRAEARLEHARWRQAYRACSYPARHAQLSAMPLPATCSEALARTASYHRAFGDMEAVALAYTRELRRRIGVRAAHGSTDARLRRAAHHELVGVSRGLATDALILSRPRSGRPSKDERRALARGPPHVCGPPRPIADFPLPLTSARLRG